MSTEARLDDGLLVTLTGSGLGRFDPAQISRVDGDGQHLAGEKPSGEES
jgi:hypothetical protein